MNPAPVSVVIPCYCCSDVLDRAVHSVARQSRIPSELILVDDASPDSGATRACMLKIAENASALAGCQIRLMHHSQNLGPSGARNSGWAVATQEYVAFLDADDAWYNDKLQLQFSWMSSNPDIALTGHFLDYGDNAGLIASVAASTPSRRITLRGMLFRNRILTSTVMVRRDVEHRFVSGERYSEDYSLWLNLLADGHDAVSLELPLARAYRQPFSSGGQSGALWEMERAELRIYRQLLGKRKIDITTVAVAMLFSLLKYFKRVLTSGVRLASNGMNKKIV